MLKYDTHALLRNKNTYYELVVSVAKRARAIVEQAEAEGEIVSEKPVRLAIDELQSGKYVIKREEIAQEEYPIYNDTPRIVTIADLDEAMGEGDDEDEDYDEDDAIEDDDEEDD